MKILDGNGTTTAAGAVAETVTLQVGSGSGQTMDVVFKSWVPEVAWESANVAGGGGETTDTILTTGANDSTTSKTAYGTAVLAYDADDDDAQDTIAGGQDKYIDIKTSGAATVVIAQIDKAITAAAAERATYGAYINRLEYASDNLLNVAQNTDASRSQIEDADYAAETSELARTQIIAQASTAMLAQANQTKQSVLALLQ